MAKRRRRRQRNRSRRSRGKSPRPYEQCRFSFAHCVHSIGCLANSYVCVILLVGSLARELDTGGRLIRKASSIQNVVCPKNSSSNSKASKKDGHTEFGEISFENISGVVSARLCELTGSPRAPPPVFCLESFRVPSNAHVIDAQCPIRLVNKIVNKLSELLLNCSLRKPWRVI